MVTCEICCAVPEKAGKTEFSTSSQTFKKETLVRHNVTGGHMRTRDALLAKQQPLEIAPITQHFRKGEKNWKNKAGRNLLLKSTSCILWLKRNFPLVTLGLF